MVRRSGAGAAWSAVGPVLMPSRALGFVALIGERKWQRRCTVNRRSTGTNGRQAPSDDPAARHDVDGVVPLVGDLRRLSAARRCESREAIRSRAWSSPAAHLDTATRQRQVQRCWQDERMQTVVTARRAEPGDAEGLCRAGRSLRYAGVWRSCSHRM